MPTSLLPHSVVRFQGILVYGVVQEDILARAGWSIVVKLRNRLCLMTSLGFGHFAWDFWGLGVKALGLSAF